MPTPTTHWPRRAAAESTVLLKNEDNLLPLAAGTNVAVIGDFAETPRYQGCRLQRGPTPSRWILCWAAGSKAGWNR